MKFEWKTCFRVGVSAFLFYLAVHYWPAWSQMAVLLAGAAKPLFIGCVIAYLVNILMSTYERHYFINSKNQAIQKSRRVVCMTAAFLTLLGIVCLLIKMVIPELISCASILAQELPTVLERGVVLLEKNESLSLIIAENLEPAITALDWKEFLSKALKLFTAGFGGMLGAVMATASSLVSAAATCLIGGIFAIYLLAGKEKLACQCRRILRIYLPSGWNRRVLEVLSVLNNSFRRFIVGQCVEALILGGLCTVGMLVLRFPYATMIGALVGFTALIPVAGAYIGAGVGAFMILTVSPLKAVGFLVYVAVLQQLEGNLIYPKVVGSSIGLPGLWVLAAVTVGGGIFGIAGMLIGVPLAAALYQLLRMDMARKEC